MTTTTPDDAPAPAPAWPQRAAIGLRWIAGFIVAVLAWVGLQVLDVWPAWVLAAVVGLALVLALPIWLIRRAGARGRLGWSARRAYGSTALVVLVLLILVLATPIYYLALRGELRPAAVPQAVLSNGPKTVVFQGMVHIGSEPYYKGMVYEVGKALTEGSALFYEGVIEHPGVPGGDPVVQGHPGRRGRPVRQLQGHRRPVRPVLPARLVRPGGGAQEAPPRTARQRRPELS
jgi:hypothetical protein